jgi:hypothetical protein
LKRDYPVRPTRIYPWRRRMSRLRGYLLSTIAALALVNVSIADASIPTVWQLLGQSVAQSAAETALLDIGRSLSANDGYSEYKKAMIAHMKKLDRLAHKHGKARRKEESRIQLMVDDLKRYTPGDPDTNRTQEIKLKKIREYASKCARADKERARKLEQYHKDKCPQLQDFVSTY